MLHNESLAVLLGAIALGFVHGVEPGHGWPVAASYALDRSNKWLYGFAASLILGVGHLVSSIAMVLVFFLAKDYFGLTQVNDPIALAPGVRIGGPVGIVAGLLLIALGVREYFHGHSHDHGEGAHSHDGGREHDHDHGHAHGHDDRGGHDAERGSAHTASGSTRGGWLARARSVLPFVGGRSNASESPLVDDAEPADDERGLWEIAGFAFVLGFAHEEEFEIIALCAGSDHCLELMLAYALTVIVGLVGLTMLLIAGYARSEERVERYTAYLPAFSAAVLIVMGLGFITGVL
ncbi:hypothetical protein [Halegenticoccus tardaugens]|uniref:hypothetical protein n=1 Tax=Halegenticoccus tardaugens TaxID=2071624 RepID=UPI00100AA488|nr:hypothetical protein [Halegenticoccus tardaugens]